jgi:ABC-type Fe3+-siderophore transport system permease subunit
MERARPRSIGATIGFIAIPVVVGIPMVAYLWETLNQLLTGEVSARRIGISIPVFIVFALLLWWLARRVVAFDRGSDTSSNRSA